MDPGRSGVEALAILGERIVATGSTEEISALAGPRTQILDAAQCTVLPGFNDAHVHFLAGGFSLSNLDLRAARSPEELAQQLGKHAARLPVGTWIQGGDWDHENWSPLTSRQDSAWQQQAVLPSRQFVDPVTREHPVLVTRFDGHMALANSLALRLAGVTRDTSDPPGGVIVRAPGSSEPTGILKDSAQQLVERVIPPKSLSQKQAALLAATRHAASCGITSVTDVSVDDELSLYQDLIAQNRLRTRIYAARSIVSVETLLKTGVRANFGNDMLRIGILKGFSDGSLGSSTARFFEPYADDPLNRGLWFDQMFPDGIMERRVEVADQAGLQVMIHAIGDEANFRILELYQNVAEANPHWERRFRIEHAQHLRPEDISRFAAQRVIASVQPYHAADDGRWCEKRLGADRCRFAYPFRSLLNSGALLAFGSDWTVAPLNPLLGIKAAVTRQTLDGRHPGGWIPEEQLTLHQALNAYTAGSAFAEFTEKSKGTLTPGKLADIVLLDCNLGSTTPEALDAVRPRLTVLGGNVVFDAEKPDQS